MKKKEKFVRFKRVNSVGCKSDSTKIANTRHLTRILTYLSSIDYANQTKIQTELGIEAALIKDALTFLLNHKIIFRLVFKGGSKVKQYVLNPLFKR